jgi:hypothetical protein
LIVPCVVSAVKSGAWSLMRNIFVAPRLFVRLNVHFAVVELPVSGLMLPPEAGFRQINAG